MNATLVAVVLGLIVIVGALAVLYIPRWQIRRLQRLDDSIPADRVFELKDEARKTLSQIVGGMVLLAGFYFTYQSVVASQQAQELARETQFSSSFATATDDLGAADMESRLGGIYALERLAEDSDPDRDFKQIRQVIEVLSAYVRKHAPSRAEAQILPSKTGVPDPPPRAPEADVQAILTVLGRQTRTPEDVKEGLYTYPLYEADLRYSDLRDADLQKANLWKTNLQGAKLNEADLREAYLGEVNLQGADLSGTNLEDADLTGADLRLTTGLKQEQINKALHGDQTTLLPPELKPPRHWGELDIPVKISLPPKEYVPEEFRPVRSFLVGEGWISEGQGSDHLYLAYGDSKLNFVSPQSAYDPKDPTNPVTSPENAEDLMAWLQRHPYLNAGEPVATTHGNISGKQFDTTVDAPLGIGFLECLEPCIPLFRTDHRTRLVFFEGYRTRTIVSEVHGEVVIITIESPISEFEEFVPKAMEVLNTVEWQGGH